MTNLPFHIQILRGSLDQRQRANSAYSLRAFSRDLGIDPSTLSQVLNDKRPLPVKKSAYVAERLRLAPLVRMKFLESAAAKRAVLDQIPLANSHERFLLDESHFRVIAEWEHYAVLTLCDLPGFFLTVAAAAKNLGLTRLRAETVLRNLSEASLIESSDRGKTYRKTHTRVRTTEDISSPALRTSHTETLEMGKTKLESVPVEERDFSCENFALAPEALPELKIAVREFREKVIALARKGDRQQKVYQMAIQVYPLSVEPARPQSQKTSRKKERKS